MTLTPADALELMRRIRMDLTNAQGKLTDAIEAISALPAAQEQLERCPACGATTRVRGGHTFSCHLNPDGPNYRTSA